MFTKTNKRVDPLVSSQEQRVLLVLLLNHLQTACQLLTLFAHSVYIPGYAAHEKSLQGLTGVDSLVNSQEQRALLILLINR